MKERLPPKVSVIIPVYNGSNFLQEAIESVFAQTYKNYELIVVDDGSKDQTWAQIQSYGGRLQGIHKENGGVSSALNCGIRKATGDYIAWLSHDDLFLPAKLDRQVDFLNRFTQFKACYTDYYTIDGNGRIIEETETPWYPRQKAIRVLFGKVYMNGSTMLIEKKCFLEAGLFSEGLRYTQDTEMWLRLSRHFEIGRVPEKLGKWRFHSSQGSQSLHIYRAEAQAMYQRIFQEFGIQGLFPEWNKSADDPEALAKARLWLGDTMSFYRGWYEFADEQYLQAARIYPPVRNVVRLKRMVNRLSSVARPGFRRLQGIGRAGLRRVRHWVQK